MDQPGFVHVGNFFDSVRKIQKRYRDHLSPICKKWKLTQNELDILLFLCNTPQYDRAADIVEHRGIAKSHVSLSVKDLEHRKLLERRFEPADRRTSHLELTDQGRDIAGEGQRRQRLFFEELYAGITAEEFELLRSLTEKIMENIENFDKTETNP